MADVTGDTCAQRHRGISEDGAENQSRSAGSYPTGPASRPRILGGIINECTARLALYRALPSGVPMASSWSADLLVAGRAVNAQVPAGAGLRVLRLADTEVEVAGVRLSVTFQPVDDPGLVRRVSGAYRAKSPTAAHPTAAPRSIRCRNRTRTSAPAPPP
ncbi:hypothetical protein [Streptomyces javensis]|uniref:Uncharacterized protein n=2 Tax=Streptomyces javensis TaxID=114698 RepID=A0ABS0R6C6_9ACTN|nr:hypothetical protein [Streptomyces javensis]MBI0312625.1 hypothetical protein [Streptomyces javensis]